ncbi:hypothetical protein [Streptomyces sclerotialus]|uniref:hypothetical protein n=1 Tax=Streptomyces sclerotialus TaxID=1957 RepID=UPI0018C9E921
MHLSHDLVQSWAEEIVSQLGAPAGHTLTVTGPGFPTSAGASGAATCAGVDGGTTASDGVAVGLLVTLAFSDGSSVSVHFEEPMPEAEAVTLLADQLQDAVLEETHGRPQPPCPGHSHPAVAEAVDNIACWTCPSGGDTAWPILC